MHSSERTPVRDKYKQGKHLPGCVCAAGGMRKTTQGSQALGVLGALPNLWESSKVTLDLLESGGLLLKLLVDEDDAGLSALIRV